MTLLILPSEALRQPRGRLSAAQRILGAKRSRLGTSEAAFLRPLGLGVSAGRSDSRISVDLSSPLHACGFLLVAASAVTRRGGRGHPSPERRAVWTRTPRDDAPSLGRELLCRFLS